MDLYKPPIAGLEITQCNENSISLKETHQGDVYHYLDRYNDDNYPLSRSPSFYNSMRMMTTATAMATATTTTTTTRNQYAARIKDDDIKAMPTSSFAFPESHWEGKTWRVNFLAETALYHEFCNSIFKCSQKRRRS